MCRDHKENEVKPKRVRCTTNNFRGKPEDVLDKDA